MGRFMLALGNLGKLWKPAWSKENMLMKLKGWKHCSYKMCSLANPW